MGRPPPVITIEAFEIYAGAISKTEKISNPTQSAHEKTNEIIRKFIKSKQRKNIARINAIFLFLFSLSFIDSSAVKLS